MNKKIPWPRSVWRKNDTVVVKHDRCWVRVPKHNGWAKTCYPYRWVRQPLQSTIAAEGVNRCNWGTTHPWYRWKSVRGVLPTIGTTMVEKTIDVGQRVPRLRMRSSHQVRNTMVEQKVLLLLLLCPYRRTPHYFVIIATVQPLQRRNYATIGRSYHWQPIRLLQYYPLHRIPLLRLKKNKKISTSIIGSTHGAHMWQSYERYGLPPCP